MMKMKKVWVVLLLLTILGAGFMYMNAKEQVFEEVKKPVDDSGENNEIVVDEEAFTVDPVTQNQVEQYETMKDLFDIALAFEFELRENYKSIVASLMDEQTEDGYNRLLENWTAYENNSEADFLLIDELLTDSFADIEFSQYRNAMQQYVGDVSELRLLLREAVEREYDAERIDVLEKSISMNKRVIDALLLEISKQMDNPEERKEERIHS